MKLFYGVLCGAVLLLLNAGCGSARAIVGDHDDDAIVSSIKPTSGESGQTANFEAQVCTKPGVAKPTYNWNFGGAADPNVSFEEAPQVTLRAGRAAPYDATLTLTGGCLGGNLSVTTPFQISVAPLTVLSVTGTTGINKGSGNFAAVIGTGVPTHWAWDFGGAASPSGSTAENPTVTFGAVAGVFQGHVVVSNDFEAVDTPFTINVL